MQFIREDAAAAVQAITGRISVGLLAGQRVLWLTSGGSNIALEVSVMKQLRDQCDDKLKGLAVLPIDERYGKPGHPDSNTGAMRSNGFDPGIASWIDILVRDLPFDQTITFYSDAAATAFANADLIVGQVGLGGDAHIAGILPDSPATAPGAATVIGYEWSDYTRLTLSAEMLQQIDVAFVPVYGPGKKKALERLRRNNEPFERLPAKLLYELPECYVYNDFLESEGKK